MNIMNELIDELDFFITFWTDYAGLNQQGQESLTNTAEEVLNKMRLIRNEGRKTSRTVEIINKNGDSSLMEVRGYVGGATIDISNGGDIDSKLLAATMIKAYSDLRKTIGLHEEKISIRVRKDNGRT